MGKEKNNSGFGGDMKGFPNIFVLICSVPLLAHICFTIEAKFEVPMGIMKIIFIIVVFLLYKLAVKEKKGDL